MSNVLRLYIYDSNAQRERDLAQNYDEVSKKNKAQVPKTIDIKYHWCHKNIDKDRCPWDTKRKNKRQINSKIIYAIKGLDNTTVADRLRTVSCIDRIHSTGVHILNRFSGAHYLEKKLLTGSQNNRESNEIWDPVSSDKKELSRNFRSTRRYVISIIEYPNNFSNSKIE